MSYRKIMTTTVRTMILTKKWWITLLFVTRKNRQIATIKARWMACWKRQCLRQRSPKERRQRLILHKDCCGRGDSESREPIYFFALSFVLDFRDFVFEKNNNKKSKIVMIFEIRLNKDPRNVYNNLFMQPKLLARKLRRCFWYHVW